MNLQYFLDRSFKKDLSFFHVICKNFGVGLFQLKKCCSKFGLKPTIKWSMLTNKKKMLLVDFLFKDKSQLKEQELRQELSMKRKNLMLARNLRGLRFQQGLPVRGQRTKTNKKTARKLNSIKNFI